MSASASAAASAAASHATAASTTAAADHLSKVPENNEEYDYIVIGGGTGACTVAGRLSENPKHRVLVLERGIDVTNDPTVKPSTYGLEIPLVPAPFTPVETFTVGPDPNLIAQKGFNLEYAAKAWGGGPAISGSFWGRGDPANYDEWAAMGNPGWDYASCLPFFKISEHFFMAYNPDIPISGDRGTKGPVGAGSLNLADPNNKPFLDPFCKTFDAPAIHDSSTSKGQFGISPMVRSLGLDVAKPARNSTYVTYLEPHLAERKNLHCLSLAVVSRVLFEPSTCGKAGTKPKVHGVQYTVNGKSYVARAKHEVILGAGTIGTPKILMYSGIGEAGELTKWGIPVVHNLPGVGKMMTNHFSVSFSIQVSPQTMPQPVWPGNGANIGFLRSADFADRLAELAKAKAPAGMTTTAAAAAVAGASKTAKPADAKDAKAADAKAVDKKIDIELSWAVAPLPGSTPNSIIGFIADLRNMFRGVISLKSANPFEQPNVTYFTPNPAGGMPTMGLNLQSPDVLKIVNGFRMVRSWLFDTGLCSPNAPDNSPSLADVPLDATDAQWIAWISKSICGLYHWASSAHMGPTADPFAVCDTQCRVYGVEGLRIADCSAMPLVVTTHPSATAVMMGERVAYWIQGWSKHADPALEPKAAAAAPSK